MTTNLNDAMQAAYPFVIAQGRNIEAKVYQKKYPSYNYARVVPVVSEGNEWAIGTTFFTMDTTGEAKFLSGKANDMPFVNATHDQASHDFALLGAGWEWTLEEINQARLYNIDLAATKAMAASDSIERKLNDIAFLGSAEKNWTGFGNAAGIATSSAGQTVIAGTSIQNSDLINDALSAVRTNTNDIEYADTLALPPAAFRKLATQRSGVEGDITTLEYLRKNNVYTAETGQALNIIPVRELAKAGAGGTGRMVVYRRDEEVLRFHLPMPKRMAPIHHKSIMAYETGFIARTGGTEWRLPGAAVYVDGVTPA